MLDNKECCSRFGAVLSGSLPTFGFLQTPWNDVSCNSILEGFTHDGLEGATIIERGSLRLQRRGGGQRLLCVLYDQLRSARGVNEGLIKVWLGGIGSAIRY